MHKRKWSRWDRRVIGNLKFWQVHGVVKLTQLEEDGLVGIGLSWYIDASENSFMECYGLE